jgi:tRNA A37 threonylcarbamoyladenosine dehydratase
MDEIDKVSNATVAIAGLGGVGAITAELLARWGVKKFRLLDMDRYEPSNLNRQLFATSKTLGRYKAEVAAERIMEINPYAEIEMIICSRVDNENVHPFVAGADMVIQNADYPSCKLFYLTARKHKVPLVNGYASITGGRVQTFDYRVSPCRSILESWWNRLKFGDSKPLEEMSTEEIAEFDHRNVHATAPSINFVTNMTGCLIVAEAIKLITGRGKVILYPQYLEFDSFHFKMKVRNSNSTINPENVKRLFAAIRK